MSIAVAIKHMMAAGMSPDAIVAAVAEMEAALKREPAQKSGWRADAKREARARRKAALPTNPRALGVNPRALGVNPRAE